MKPYYPDYDPFLKQLDDSFYSVSSPVFLELSADTSTPFGPSAVEIVAKHLRHYPKCVLDGQVNIFDE